MHNAAIEVVQQMKENYEFRIVSEYYNLLSKPNGGKFNGACYVVRVLKEDPLFEEIKKLQKEIREKNKDSFFLYSNVKRKFTEYEIDNSILFHLIINKTFEPAGEECGTIYDETTACEICGSNRKQIGFLKLKKATIPKQDISRTIAGEIIISERFANLFSKSKLSGAEIRNIQLDKGTTKHYQLIINSSEVDLTSSTIGGVDIFDKSTESSDSIEFEISGGYKIKMEKEVYKCPKGHTIGLNLLSIPSITKSSINRNSDLLISRQKIGVKRGLLRPEPIIFCSSRFRVLALKEEISGLDFQIVKIE